jgi:hypothetical protein
MGLLGGLSAVAGLRAAAIILGPLNVLFTGLQVAMMPAAVRSKGISTLHLRRMLRWMSIILGTSAMLFGVVVAILPEDLLVLILGSQAAGASAYVLPFASCLAGTGLAAGSHVGMKVLHARLGLLSARMWSAVIFVGTGAIAYYATQSVFGGLWGLAIGGGAGVLVWERSFENARRAVAAGE